MKVAICLYGKFTGKNARGERQGFEIPYKCLKKHVLTENTDIFFHAWDDDSEESKKLVELYKPKKFLLEPQRTFDHPYKHYDFVPSGDWNTKSYINNNYSRFYSFKKAMELVDDSYDLVLVSRFDNVWYSGVDFGLFNPENMYVSHWNHLSEGWGFNDAWFISGTKNIRDLSAIYDRLNDYYDIGHSEFFKFIKRHGMNEVNMTSAHILWKYRTVELGLEEKTYAYGLEYKTWGLLRRLGEMENPWGTPSCDIMTPIKISDI